MEHTNELICLARKGIDNAGNRHVELLEMGSKVSLKNPMAALSVAPKLSQQAALVAGDTVTAVGHLVEIVAAQSLELGRLRSATGEAIKAMQSRDVRKLQQALLELEVH